jgi:hypothetical protein
MAWAEHTGTRQIADELGYIDYTISFIGLTSDPLPAQGATIGTIVSGATALPSLGLVDEPEAVSIGRRQKVTANKSMVTVRFRGFKSGA